MRHGFSLFEMIIALSLMALLGTIVVPNLKKVQDKGFSVTSEVNARTFQSSLENYFLDNNTYPVGQLYAADLYSSLKTGDYLNSCPVNPFTHSVYSNSDTKGKITYSSSSDGSDYTLTLYDKDGQTVQLVLNKL